MINFYVGQKVVCIDADSGPSNPFYIDNMDGLTLGAVYTVRKVGLSPIEWCLSFPPSDPHSCLWLGEITRAGCFEDGSGPELGFAARRFRPLIATDISNLKALLSPIPEQDRKLEEASA